MSLKKTIKKSISWLLPKSNLKEQLKVIWYNLISNSQVKYKISRNHGKELVYETYYNNLTFFTNEPLYTITPDFDNYQHYYKVKENDYVIDGGANVGVLSLLFSKIVGPLGYVFCFEPDIYNIQKLKSNFGLNTHYNNYCIEEELIWSSETIIDFQEAGTVASSALWFSSKNEIIKKKATTIDNWCMKNNISHIDFVKMDIEGAELEGVEGCRELIKKFEPNFAIASYHMVDGEPTYIKLEAFFESINYPYITKHFGGYERITFAGPAIKSI